MTRTAVCRIATAAGALCLAAVSLAHAQPAPPAFSKAFAPSTIAADGASTLIFTISNPPPSPVSDLTFMDTLPAGVTITDPAITSTDCLPGVVDAPAGGSTITFTSGNLGAGASCTVTVTVTSGIAGVHTNTSGDLTSSAGNSGPATADLTVGDTLPVLSKAFSPDVIAVGGASTLTFTIDNPSAMLVSNIIFVDTLPTGVVIANPADVVTDCAGVVTAVPGTNLIQHFTGFLQPASSCTISVRVQANVAGIFDNQTADLNSTAGNSGFAVARLRAVQNFLSKSFVDDPVAPGGTVTLEFTLVNFDRNNPVTAITFTDDLDATLSGLVAVGLPANDVCGNGSQISGTSLLTFTGGNLPPEGSCTFQVTLQVPAGAAPGLYPNTTSAVTGDVLGSPVNGPPATDDLAVQPAPALTKTFLNDPAVSGGTVDLEFTITNTDPASSVTGITFSDDLTALFGGITATTLPANGFCGAGSQITGITLLVLTGGNLGPGASCTFQVTLQLPAGMPGGAYPNVTSAITGTVGGEVYTGNPASDDLVVASAPRLTKLFLDPVVPGATVVLRFELAYDENAPAGATGISFTDDLAAVLTGLTAIGLPANDVCGVGSQISGTTLLTFTGGTLGPAESCSFDVTLQVPAGAVPGDYANTTSDVSATSLGLMVSSPAATDELNVVGLTFVKQFTDDPAVPGGTVTLEFTISNVSATQNATAIFFTDNLTAVLPGLAAVGLPVNDVCGAGSQISGTTLLILTGGNLGPGTSCTFPVTLQIPAGASPGEYTNVTSSLSADVDGSPVLLLPAADSLILVDALSITKEFIDDPAVAGGTVTLEFTISNAAAQPATGISFTDDLDAALSGLVAVGLPANNVCGAGSVIGGTSVLTLTGGNLAAGGSCTFQVTLQVPAAVSPGTTALNTTSSVTGTVGGVGVTGAPASDVLRIEFLSFAKAFDGVTTAGGSPVLTFTLVNLDPVNPISGLGFLDDLDAVLTGLVAVGLPANGVCGGGSQITGTSLLTFTGGSLGPGASCSFGVTLQVPAGAAPGVYPNTTSNLTSSGLLVANPATANLGVEPPPTFAKAFAPDSIGVGGLSTLSFVIDNSASAVAASALDFTDNLPAGVEVANPANASTTCTGGTITAVPASGVISYTGGSVAAGASCTVQVDVTATASGDLVNTTGDLTSSSGNSGTATDTLTVNPQPGFAKSFAPDTIAPGGVSTLTFTIDNSGSTVDATALDFTDNLPAAVTVATPANASTTCTGGTVTAVAGTGVISYTGGTVAAGATCTVQADVTATTTGAHVNVSGALTSSLGASGTATDTLTVPPPPGFAKSFAPDPIAPGGVSTLTFTIDNSASTLDATALDFTDNLPAAVTVATPANASTTCTGGTVTAVAGSGVISYTGGTVAAGATCAVQADVTATTTGTHVNVSGALTSSLGASGTATDSLTVVSGIVSLTKAFLSTPVLRGGTVDVEFTIVNTSPDFGLAAIAFTDDLDAALSGLVAIGLPAADVCGTGSQLSGTSVISLTGGNLPVSGSCTFAVTLLLPVDAPLGVFTNTTSTLTASAAGAPVDAPPASDDVEVVFLELTKAFDPTAANAGEEVALTFTIVNPDPVNSADAIGFTDDLDAALPGLVAIDTPLADVCGTGSMLTGTSLLTLAGGSLPAGGSCTFAVTLLLPADTLTGTITNLTSAISAEILGTPVTGDPAGAAAATLDVTGSPLVIPTLGTSAMVLLAAMLALMALAMLRRRERQALEAMKPGRTRAPGRPIR